jgi:hypothetical protein
LRSGSIWDGLASSSTPGYVDRGVLRRAAHVLGTCREISPVVIGGSTDDDRGSRRRPQSDAGHHSTQRIPPGLRGRVFSAFLAIASGAQPLCTGLDGAANRTGWPCAYIAGTVRLRAASRCRAGVCAGRRRAGSRAALRLNVPVQLIQQRAAARGGSERRLDGVASKR